MGRIFYEWNDLDAAEQHGQQSLQLARQYDKSIDRFVAGGKRLVFCRPLSSSTDILGSQERPMLLTFDRLRAKPTIFKAFTGVSLSEFETLLTQSTPLWVASEQQRLSRPDRQRALGGGRKPRFALREQLLVTLVWLRLYLSTETLGFLFGIDKATVSRYTRAFCQCCARWVMGRWAGSSRHGAVRARISPRPAPPTPTCSPSWTPPNNLYNAPRTLNPETALLGKKKRHTRKAQLIVNE